MTNSTIIVAVLKHNKHDINHTQSSTPRLSKRNEPQRELILHFATNAYNILLLLLLLLLCYYVLFYYNVLHNDQ